MNTKTIILSTIAVLVTFAVLFGVYKLVSQPAQSDFSLASQLKADDHIKWSPNKKNLLVEYSDLQCPACQNAHNYFKEFEASGSPDFAITKKVTFVFRYFPLTQIHDKALVAAYAAEAASRQGKFWQMTDMLFDNQSTWEQSNNPQAEFFDKYAKNLKLDVAKFNTDVASNAVKDRINEDLQTANQMGLDSTPTFFLNGQKLDNLNSYDDLKKMLQNL